MLQDMTKDYDQLYEVLTQRPEFQFVLTDVVDKVEMRLYEVWKVDDREPPLTTDGITAEFDEKIKFIERKLKNNKQCYRSINGWIWNNKKDAERFVMSYYLSWKK